MAGSTRATMTGTTTPALLNTIGPDWLARSAMLCGAASIQRIQSSCSSSHLRISGRCANACGPGLHDAPEPRDRHVPDGASVGGHVLSIDPDDVNRRRRSIVVQRLDH